MQLTTLPIESLRESPFNYRRTYREATLRELADNIASIGIQQPIKVRPLPDAQMDHTERYEIIFGHRRYRAAKLAQLEYVSVIIDDMSDDDVRIAQLSENIQREDTSPIEEAEALRELIDTCGVRVDKIIDDTGKSRSHIYQTLRLVKLTPEVREAVEAKLIGREIALLIASVPASMQKKALACVVTKDTDGTTPVAVSYRAAKRVLMNGLFVPLASAQFDPTCPDLAKLAGPCTKCPRLSQNDPATAADLDADVCTDKSCFDVKARAHTANVTQKAREQGFVVLEGEAADNAMPGHQASWFFGHSSLDSTVHACGKDIKLKDAVAVMRSEGVEVPQLVMHINSVTQKPTMLVTSEGERAIRQFLSEADSESGATTQAAPHQPTARTFESPLHEAAFNHRQAIRQAIRLAALTGPRRVGEVHILAEVQLCLIGEVPTELVEHFGWQADLVDIKPYDQAEWVATHKLPHLSAEDAARIAMFLSLTEMPSLPTHDAGYPAQLLKLATMYEIDAAAACATAEATQASDDADDIDDTEADEE